MGLLGRGVKQRNMGWMSDEVLFRPEEMSVTQANVLPPLYPARPRRLPGQCGSAGVPGPWVLPDSGNGRSAPGLPGPHPGIRAGPSSFGPSELQGPFPYVFGAGVH